MEREQGGDVTETMRRERERKARELVTDNIDEYTLQDHLWKDF
jgi:hypothetical protein